MKSLSRRSAPYRRRRVWYLKLELLVKSQLARVPLLEAVARPPLRLSKHSWRTIKRALAVLIQSLISKGYRDFDTDEVIWVSPKDITFCALREFNIEDFRGMIIGGDWDRLEKRFEDLDVFHALGAVLVDGQPWERTVFYQRIMDDLGKGGIPWGCRDQRDFDKRCRGLERLFRDIKYRGYRSQEQLAREPRSTKSARKRDEVAVSVGRHGDFLFSDGAHRLAIAKILEIDKIPARIAVRHPEWVCYVRQCHNSGNVPQKGKDRTGVPPDLCGITADRVLSEDRE